MGNKEVDKATFDKHNSNKFDTCVPCHVKYYTTDGKLFKESDQYILCDVGMYKEFHTNGKLKVSGRFTYRKERKDGFEGCSLKHGTWKYYDYNGKLIGTSVFDQGKIVKTESK